jgi:hypothetical protein
VSTFRHPYLIRGIVHTSAGAFIVCRGIVQASDAIGHAFGWQRIDEDDAPMHEPSMATSPRYDSPLTRVDTKNVAEP